MIKNADENFAPPPAAGPPSEFDTCLLADEKRRLVDSLETMRRNAAKAGPAVKGMPAKPRHTAEKPTREEAYKKLGEALQGQEELCMCVQALYEEANDIDILQQNLKSAAATCTMQEETIESFENKLLEVIADNGKLYQWIDKVQSELMTSKAVSASLARLRDNLRSRNEELRHLNETHRLALAAAEREILSLTARFEESRAKHQL